MTSLSLELFDYRTNERLGKKRTHEHMSVQKNEITHARANERRHMGMHPLRPGQTDGRAAGNKQTDKSMKRLTKKRANENISSFDTYIFRRIKNYDLRQV